MSVLLITATINSGYFGNVGTTVSDTEVRRNEYKTNLEKYITESTFDKIIFAENSGDHLDEAYFSDLAEKRGKKLEFLYLPSDIAKTQKYGKSYGEASLIEDAVLSSTLLKGEESFYKVTGRIWVKNINALVNNKAENCFIAHNFMAWVLTSFFKMRTDDFRKVLSDAHAQCNDHTEDCIEHVYFKLLKDCIHSVNSFRVYPDLVGINSGSGWPYTKTEKQLRERNILLKLGVYRYDSKYHWYYPLINKLNERVH